MMTAPTRTARNRLEIFVGLRASLIVDQYSDERAAPYSDQERA